MGTLEKLERHDKNLAKNSSSNSDDALMLDEETP